MHKPLLLTSLDRVELIPPDEERGTFLAKCTFRGGDQTVDCTVFASTLADQDALELTVLDEHGHLLALGEFEDWWQHVRSLLLASAPDPACSAADP